MTADGRAVVRFDGGRLDVHAANYRLVQPRADRPFARLLDLDGRAWADLALLAAVHAIDGPDEWWSVGEPSVAHGTAGPTVTWTVRSARWDVERLVLEATPEAPRVRVEVEGRGRIADVELLAGRGSAWGRMGTGRFASGRLFQSLLSGGPDDPRRIVQPAAEAASVGVVGGAQPGRGRWFFTPGPFAFAISRAPVVDLPALPGGPWLVMALEVEAVADAGFTSFDYRADDLGFGLRFAYEGHTRVDGRWTSPWLSLRPGFHDPYAAVGSVARDAGAAPLGTAGDSRTPGWWLEPMFCGWGAQVAEALPLGLRPAALSRADRYDAWLARLAAAGVVPGTVAIDDAWQRTYGRNEPDEDRWPDLAGWIERRHSAGQRVLLWWKAWDPDGLPSGWCVQDGDGRPITADPTNPDYARALASDVRRLLAPRADGGLGADGLKIDFTGQTPSGAGLRTHAEREGGSGPWGVALLHRLLEIVATAAREVRPDTLLITHAPNPLFRDVLSMVRLNDALRLDDPEPLVPVIAQLGHRAALAAAALPGVPIDTDDWAMPSLAEWRRWRDAKGELGVPALYHVNGLGTTDERLTDDDLRGVADAWTAYRSRRGLPGPRPGGGRAA